MTPFVKQECQAASSMIQRTAMLAQPCESFKSFFEGRVPSMAEKAFFVEKAVQKLTALNVFGRRRVSAGREMPRARHLEARDEMGALGAHHPLGDFPRQLIAGIGGVCTVPGFLVLIGWHLHLPALIQLRPTLAPMQYNTALCFIIAGVALVLWARNWAPKAPRWAVANREFLIVVDRGSWRHESDCLCEKLGTG